MNQQNIIRSLLDAMQEKEVIISEQLFKLFCDLTEADFKYYLQKELITIKNGDVRLSLAFSETERVIATLPTTQDKKAMYLAIYSNVEKFFNEEEIEYFKLQETEINYRVKEFITPQMFFLYYCNLKMQDVGILESLEYFDQKDSIIFGRGGKKFLPLKVKNNEVERALLKFPTKKEKLLLHAIASVGEYQVLNEKEKVDGQYLQEQILKIISGHTPNKNGVVTTANLLQRLKGKQS